MLRTAPRHAFLAVALTLPVHAQFVEKAQVVGLIHECLPGMDQMVGPGPDFDYVVDWVQQGVALGDLDGDGDLDVVACGGLGPSTVFRNDAGTFVDITASTGIDSREFDRAPYFGDYDNDGDLDLYVAALQGGPIGDDVGKSRLYQNDGSGFFTDVTVLAGVHGAGHSLCAAWADFDKDGLLDLYVGEFIHTPNRYYQNNGDGTFSDRGAALGIDHQGSAHCIVPVDSDDDGYLDIFLGVDFDVSKVIGIPPEENFGNATFGGLPGGLFVDNTVGSGYDIENAPMGATVGDIDYDGDPDIYESDLGSNPLFVNYGWPAGAEWDREERDYGIENPLVGPTSGPGVPQKASGWGVNFMDADHDLWLDLFVVNGHVAGVNPFTSILHREQQNFFFQGDGPPLFMLSDQSAAFGLDDTIDDRGSAIGDMDGDGDLDLFVTPTFGRLRYFENQLSTSDGWLIVDVVAQTSGAGGVGATVQWFDSLGHPHTRWIGADNPTASQSDRRAHFGLGQEASVDVEVDFPSGITLDFPGVLPNTLLTATEPKLIELSTRVLPIPIAALPGEPTTVTVTAYAHDQAGTPLDGTAVVTIDAGTLTPTGPVQHVAGNQFERTFQVANSAGPHRVAVSFDAWAVEVEPVVHCSGFMSSVRSTVRVTPDAVRAGSSDPIVVDVVPKDGAQVSVGTGHTVVVTLGAEPPQPAVDLGNGIYRATFTAPAAPGTVSVSATVQGLPLSGPMLEVAGPCDGAASDLLVLTPLPAQSATPHQLKVLFTPRDSAGRRVGPHADVELRLGSLAGDAGLGQRGGGKARKHTGASPGGSHVIGQQTPPDQFLSVRDSVVARDDGSYLFVIEKPIGSSALPAGTLRFLVEDLLVRTEPFDFDPTK